MSEGPTASQTDASSQLNLDTGAWEDLWPEVSEAPVLAGEIRRPWGVWPEHILSPCHLQGDPGQIASPARAPATDSATRGSWTRRAGGGSPVARVLSSPCA